MERHEHEAGHDVKTFMLADKAVQYLMMDSPTRAAVLLIIDPMGTIRMLAAPKPKLVGDNVMYINTNASNTEFNCVTVSPSVLQQSVSFLPRDEIPEFLRPQGATALTNDHKGDAYAETQVVNLFAVPRGILLPSGKKWIEGSSSDTDIQQELGAEYGPQVEEVVKAWVAALNARVANAGIYNRVMQTPGALASYLGTDAAKYKLTTNPPTTHITPITLSTHPDIVELRRRQLSPFITAPTVPDAGRAAGSTDDATAFKVQADAIATALMSKEERKEISRLSSGNLVIKSVWMAGTYDPKTGKVDKLYIADFTTAYTEACQETTKDEKLQAVLRLVNTNNASRATNCTHSIFRNMEVHDQVLMSGLIGGNFGTLPMTDITAKMKDVRIVCFLPHAQEVLERLRNESRDENMNDSLGVDGNNSRNWIVVSARDVGYESLKGMFANFISCCHAIFIVTVPGRIPFVIIMAENWLNFIIESKTKTWFDNKNTELQQKQFVFYVIQRFDHMLSMMATAGQDYTTNKAVKAGDADAIELAIYDEAMQMAVDDLGDALKWVKRSAPCKVDITCLPVEKSPSKKQRIEQQPQQQQQQQQQQRNGQRNSSAQRGGHNQGLVVDGQGWGDGTNDDWTRSRLVSANERRKKGDIIAKRGCNEPLAPALKERHCVDFAVLGRACPGCNKIHKGIYQWSAEDRAVQTEYVVKNRNYLKFNAASVKFLSEDKKYLLATKEGPVGERA